MQQTGRLVHAKTVSTNTSFYPSTFAFHIFSHQNSLQRNAIGKILDIFSFKGGWKRLGSTQWSCLSQTESTRRLRYNFCFSLFWVFTSLSLSSPVHKQPSLGHLIIIDKIFLPVALSGNTSYSIIKNKIKRSAQDQSNMNLFDSKGSFFIYFFCQRLIRTYETFMLLMMMIIMIIIWRWFFLKLLKYFKS